MDDDAPKLFLLSLLLLFQGTTFASNDTIHANGSIKDGSLVISNGGMFALGFFSPGRSSYRYVGIWYHNKPGQAPVWVANKNNPINDTSGVLSSDGYGNLFLYSSLDQDLPVWSANVSRVFAEGTCFAQLLDSGNLVLVQGTSNRTIVWQSFDYPTDTLLAGMKLGLDRETGFKCFLTSWRSADDPGTGDFSFKINPNGSPQIFMYHKGTIPNWRSMPWPWRVFHQFYNDSVVNNEHSIHYSFLPRDPSIVLMLRIDSSGTILAVTWDEVSGQWKEFYSVTRQKCDVYGYCGSYGKCEPSSPFLSECVCLPGYESKSPSKLLFGDPSGGCVRKRSKSSSFCERGEGFVRVSNVKVPDTSAAVWVDMGLNEVNCEHECRKNCSCSAYATISIVGKGTGCLTWNGELMDTVNYPSPDNEIYVRVDAIELADDAIQSSGFRELKVKLVFLIPSVASVWLVVVLFAYWCLKRLKKSRKRKATERRIRSLFHPGEDGSNYFQDSPVTKEITRSKIYPELPFFSLSTIRAATNNFSPDNKLGQGGFGSVYKGKLNSGEEVAVKRSPKNSKGLEQFKSEVFLIARLQHRNLVKLHGCCIEEQEQMLVYEYLPYKSLDSLLFADQTTSLFLDWSKRFNIILGVARGILYLHQDSRCRIIHRDLKTSNVLLDAELNPKISDFGMARVLEGDQVEGKTSKIGGTYGYMSPEYAYLGKFSVKSDVFSFGVMLLEIVMGKKINGFYQEDSTLSLIGCVWELWNADRVVEIVDPSLEVSNGILRCIHIGLLCLEEDSLDRPDMQAVVVMLSSERIPLPAPKRPAFVYAKSRVEESAAECSRNELTFSDTLGR